MYHPAAQIHFGDKVHKGAAAITHELTRLGAKFSAVTLQSLFVVDQWPDRIEFETEVEGRFGRMLIHHLWHVHAGKVRQHDASVVAYRRAAEQLPA